MIIQKSQKPGVYQKKIFDTLTDVHKLSRIIDAELASLVDQSDVHLSWARTWWGSHCDGVRTQKL